MNANLSARQTSGNLLSRAASTALMLSALAGTAAAQPPPVTRVRIDDGSVRLRIEMALRASHSSLDIMAAWAEYQNVNYYKVFYNLSTDGIGFREDPKPVPLPRNNQGDPCWIYP